MLCEFAGVLFRWRIYDNMIRICCRILYFNNHLITICLNHSSKLHLSGNKFSFKKFRGTDKSDVGTKQIYDYSNKSPRPFNHCTTPHTFPHSAKWASKLREPGISAQILGAWSKGLVISHSPVTEGIWTVCCSKDSLNQNRNMSQPSGTPGKNWKTSPRKCVLSSSFWWCLSPFQNDKSLADFLKVLEASLFEQDNSRRS